MVNEGRLAPVVDVVQALRDDAAGAGNSAKGGGVGKGGVGVEDSGKPGGHKNAAKRDVRGLLRSLGDFLDVIKRQVYGSRTAPPRGLVISRLPSNHGALYLSG